MHSNRYLFLLIFLFPLHAFTQVSSCKYVIAPSGLNVRAEASLSGKVVAKIPYAHLVQVLDSSGVQLTIRDGGKDVKSEWIRIAYYLELGEDQIDTGEGYVFGAFLGDADEVTRIPPSTLYLSYYLYFVSPIESQVNVCTPYQNRNPWKFEAGSRQHEHDMRCYAYYERYLSQATLRWTEITDTTTWAGVNHTRIVNPEDTLRHYLKIELVDGAALRKRKVKSDYDPDLRLVQKPVPDTFPDFDTPNSYILYLDGGRDSIHIQDYYGEYATYHRFVGRLHKLNSYLISADFETPMHYLVDMTTGKKTWWTDGMPCISPDGKYVLTFHYEWYPYGYEGCAMGLCTLDTDSKAVQPSLHANMQTWIQVGGPDSVFWISDRELVIQAVPVRNFVEQGQMNEPPKATPQYLKITIQDRD